jgi:hypothetical protein
MTEWNNKDGLVVRFGEDRSEQIQQGVVCDPKNYLVVKLEDATALVDTLSTSTPPDEDAPFVPANSLVTGAWFTATTDFTSAGSATLDIGFQQADGTLIDADGIAADITVAELTDGAGTGAVACNGAYVCNGSGSTTTVRDGGQLLTQNGYIGFSYETAVFTGGVGYLIVEYVKVA